MHLGLLDPKPGVMWNAAGSSRWGNSDFDRGHTAFMFRGTMLLRKLWSGKSPCRKTCAWVGR